MLDSILIEYTKLDPYQKDEQKDLAYRALEYCSNDGPTEFTVNFTKVLAICEHAMQQPHYLRKFMDHFTRGLNSLVYRALDDQKCLWHTDLKVLMMSPHVKIVDDSDFYMEVYMWALTYDDKIELLRGEYDNELLKLLRSSV